MICPTCRTEYRDGFTRCSDCDGDLIADPGPEGVPQTRLVKVFETGNAALVPLIESVLADAGIEFMVKGDRLQDLFGWGRFGTNYSLVVGTVQFYVVEEDEAEARQVLETLASEAPPVEGDGPAV